MNLNFDSEIPIYLQLASQIENSILAGVFAEETQIPSTTEVSINYKINPATVLKGYNILVDGGIIYKKRGVGMFVAQGAVATLKQKHRAEFLNVQVEDLVKEGKKLNISKDELLTMIEEAFNK